MSCFSEQGDLKVLEVKDNTQTPCEATNKEAFFSRVESYSISLLHIIYLLMDNVYFLF